MSDVVFLSDELARANRHHHARRKIPQQEVFDLSASLTSPDLGAHFANAHEIVLPDASHYIAMEEPELVVTEIKILLSTPPPQTAE